MPFKMARAQLNLGIRLRPPPKRTWGGARPGAGRPRKDGTRPKKPGVKHRTRPALAPRFPVQVTWRIHPEVWNLRTGRFFAALESAMYSAAKDDFRVVHYSFQRDHIHLLVESSDRVALSKGMQGLGVRVAYAINALMNRRGKVMSDRYHASILRNPTMVRTPVGISSPTPSSTTRSRSPIPTPHNPPSRAHTPGSFVINASHGCGIHTDVSLEERPSRVASGPPEHGWSGARAEHPV